MQAKLSICIFQRKIKKALRILEFISAKALSLCTIFPSPVFAIQITVLSAVILLCSKAAIAAESVFDEHYHIAEKLYLQHQFRKAIKELNIAIAAAPNRFEGYYKRGKSFSEVGSPEEALPDFSKALKLSPGNAQIYVSRGLAHLRLKEQSEAKIEFEQAVKYDPKSENAYRKLLVLCEHASDNQAGIKYSTLAIKNEVAISENLMRRGSFYAALGDRQRCLDDHARAIARKKNATSYCQRGNSYVVLHDYENAMKDFEQAIKLEPRLGRYKTNLGGVLLLKKEFRKALSILTEAVNLSPDSSTAHSNRGIALEQLGMHAEAQKEFELAIQNDTAKSIYLAHHARVSLALGQNDEAIDDYVGINSIHAGTNHKVNPVSKEFLQHQFEKLIELNPSEPSNFYNRGVFFFSLKKYKEAAQDFSKFLSMPNGDSESAVYGSILYYLTLRNLHNDAAASSALARVTSYKQNSWTVMLLKTFKREDASLNEFLDLKLGTQRELTACCFVGLKQLVDGKIENAKHNLRWVVEHSSPGKDEYLLASAALNQLTGASKSSKKNTETPESTEKSPPINAKMPEVGFKSAL